MSAKKRSSHVHINNNVVVTPPSGYHVPLKFYYIFNGVPSLLMHQMALVRNSDIHHGQLLVYVCVVTVILQIGLHDLKDNLFPTCLGIMNIIL